MWGVSWSSSFALAQRPGGPQLYSCLISNFLDTKLFREVERQKFAEKEECRSTRACEGVLFSPSFWELRLCVFGKMVRENDSLLVNDLDFEENLGCQSR